MPKKMLILRGNSGAHSDESGKSHDYKWGALHEKSAKEYARRMGYEGVVLDVSGDPAAKGNRSHSRQTVLALQAIKKDAEIVALYGFSGGSYNVWWILRALKDDKDILKRLERVVVLGLDKSDSKQSDFDAAIFNDKDIHWDLIYRNDPPGTDKLVPKGAEAHMFGPERLLEDTPDPAAKGKGP